MNDILTNAISAANSTSTLIRDTVNGSYDLAIDHAISSVNFEMGKDRLIDETLRNIIIKLQKLKS